MRRPARLAWRDAHGVSTVELALIIPILMVVMAGSIDVARLISTKLRLQQAAERSAELASAGQVGGTAFTSLQTEAATAANVPATQVTVTYWLECDGTAQTSFDGTCSSGQQVARFASISIASSYKPSFSWLLHSTSGDGSIAVTGRASVRVQ